MTRKPPPLRPRMSTPLSTHLSTSMSTHLAPLLSIQNRMNTAALSGLMVAILSIVPVTNALAIDAESPTTSQPTSTAAELPKDQARTAYNKGVELFQLGQIQAEKGNGEGQKALLKEAIQQFTEALKYTPDMVEAQSNIGFAYLTLNGHRDAIKAFKKALEIQPRHMNTLNGLATTYALNGEIDLSLSTFKELTQLDSSNAQYFFNMGSVLQKSGRMEEAQKAYEDALKINPKDQRSLFNLATLFDNQGKKEKALGYYRQAKQVDVSSTIGLEAMRRVEALSSAAMN